MLSDDDDDDWEGGSLSQPLVWDGTCWVATVIVDCSDCFDHNLLARNGVRDRRIATDPANAGGRRIKGALCRWEEEILALGLKDVAGAGSIWCFLQGRGGIWSYATGQRRMLTTELNAFFYWIAAPPFEGP